MSAVESEDSISVAKEEAFVVDHSPARQQTGREGLCRVLLVVSRAAFKEQSAYHFVALADFCRRRKLVSATGSEVAPCDEGEG